MRWGPGTSSASTGSWKGADDEVETVGLWVTDGLLHALSGTSTASASPAYTARLGRVPSFTPITASKRE